MKKAKLIKIAAVILAALTVCVLFSGCGEDITIATGTPESTSKSFTEADIDYKEYVKLGEYMKITVTKDIAVSEEDIFSEYVKMLDEQEFIGVKDRVVKKGDAISLAYCGYIDGKKFAGGESEHTTLIIGSGTMIPGFEDACIGVMPGKDFDINTKFPDNYGHTDLAGKEVVFKSKVNYIFPELSDSTANIATEGEYPTADALYKFIKDGITEARESEWESSLARTVVKKVYENSEILKYPEGAIEIAIKGVEDNYKSQGITDIASYLGMTQEEYQKSVTEYAEYDMGTRLVRYRIAEIEKIEVTDEDVDAYAEENYATYGYSSAEQFIEYNTREYIRETMLLDKVDAFLVENVTIVDASKEK